MCQGGTSIGGATEQVRESPVEEMTHMSRRHWHDGPHPAFGWAGNDDSGGDAGWRPWARGERGGPGGFGPGFGPRGPWGAGPRDLGRHFWRFARHFPFGPGMGPGPFGPGGGPRMFGRGDLKFALLDLLRDRPKHGYEMIKDLEERSGGFYTPSAGAIYPTLQLLEDRGWVTAETVEGKKVYTITDAGRATQAEHQERAEAFGSPRGHGRHHHGPGRGPFGFDRETRPELAALGREAMEVAHLMRAAVMASGGNPEQLARLRAIVERAHGELNAFLGQGQTPPRQEPTSAAGQGPVEQV